MSHIARHANVLGAVAGAVADLTLAEMTAACGLAASDVAALSALRHFLDQPTIDRLRRVLGLTPSGAVRLVDRLVADGLVTRIPGRDGRSRIVELSAHGRRVADEVTEVRARTLRAHLAGLTEDERKTLDDLLGRVMTAAVNRKDGGAWICRLCDTDRCGRTDGLCPAANAALAKYGHPGPTDATVPTSR